MFSKLASKNMSNPPPPPPLLKKTFTGYQSAQESSTRFQLCATTLSLKPVLSICLPSVQTTPDRSASDTRTFYAPLTKTKTFDGRWVFFTGSRQWNSLSRDVHHLYAILIFFQESPENWSVPVRVWLDGTPPLPSSPFSLWICRETGWRALILGFPARLDTILTWAELNLWESNFRLLKLHRNR